MSQMKNGFSTLNRWLGKRNKDKGSTTANAATPNGKLSKSSTNLSVSSTNINETSQLEYNRITPLPVATSNAPFEQTFRITVLLPKEQLYVARLGARVPLSKLLELVCENKQLDAEKYEFRNPVDASQVYSCDLTIGAVGLSEVRLCHKNESYDTFNADEIIKLHRTSIIRDSLSSSEFSSRNSKHTIKTASPYSSNNSLNSMDSTGMNYTRTPVSPPAALSSAVKTNAASNKILMAPPRKKRAAPRPPSQTIPEKSALALQNDEQLEQTIESLKNTTTLNALPRKDYYVSTPNLASSTLLSDEINDNSLTTVVCNGNGKGEKIMTNGNVNGHIKDEDADDRVDACVQIEQQKNARNLYGGGSVQSLTNIPLSPTGTSISMTKFPEPSPRKRLIQIKKKSSAPAPPSRNGATTPIYADDTISIGSATFASISPEMTPTMPTTSTDDDEMLPKTDVEVPQPKPVARETTTHTKQPFQSSADVATTPIVPKPVPRLTTTTLLNASTNKSQDSGINLSETTTQSSNSNNNTNNNVSKVMLNRTPTPEPRSLSAEPPEMDSGVASLRNESATTPNICDATTKTTVEDDDNVSKQADSGIGEPIPSPLPDSLPSEGSTHECCKSTFESSSDDDDMVKVYNFKLGKMVEKPTDEVLENGEQLNVIVAAAEAATQSNNDKSAVLKHNESVTTLSSTDASSWNFTIPISPPPNFADSKKYTEAVETDHSIVSDAPITPKITERPLLSFEPLETDATEATATETTKLQRIDCAEVIDRKVTSPAPPPSPMTPLNEIVDELNTIINERRMDTLIKKVEDRTEIEAAKPNPLSNFSITTITQQQAPPPTSRPSETPLSNGTMIGSSRSNSSTASTLDSQPEDEKLYRKRSNITAGTGTGNNFPKQRKSITRSDSFHTTLLQTTTNGVPSTLGEHGSSYGDGGLNSRSSSYLSLSKLGEANALNRRRSSSELSIGESPSLQSLEIIKTILNSRKNSLANSSDDNSGGEMKVSSSAAEASKRNRITSVEFKPKTNDDHKETTTIMVDQQQSAESHSKPKEIPKVYRYSGPPSINFSTWNERPKAPVVVAIKNEGDYIFGGVGGNNGVMGAKNVIPSNAATASNNSYRASMPASSFAAAEKWKTAAGTTTTCSENAIPTMKTSTTLIQRMGIPATEVEYRERVPITVKPLKDVTYESLKTPSVTTVTLNGEHVNAASKIQVSNTSTLPRRTVDRNAKSVNYTATAPPGPSLLRATSITQLEVNRPMAAGETTSSNAAAPFGQNTLRKTGLKEKILAMEEKQQFSRHADNAESSTQTQPHYLNRLQKPVITTNGNHNDADTTTSTKSLQSAKLELKFKQPSMLSLMSTTAATKSVFVKQQQARQQSSTPPPPPPPTPATPTVITSTVRSMPMSNKASPTNGDPRNQLLEAIRNFKREELNRT